MDEAADGCLNDEDAQQLKKYRGVKAARGTKKLLKGACGWQPNFSARMDAVGVPGIHHQAKQVCLAACSSAAEAAVARDVGVLWRELKIAGGDMRGQQLNFEFTSYEEQEGLLGTLRGLDSLKQLQSYAISLRDSGWLARVAGGQPAPPADVAPAGQTGTALAGGAEVAAPSAGAAAAELPKPSATNGCKRAAAAPAMDAPVCAAKQQPPRSSGNKRARADGRLPQPGTKPAADVDAAAEAAAVVPMSVVLLHQQLEAIAQSEEGVAAGFTARGVVKYCAAYSSRLAPGQQREHLVLLEKLFDSDQYQQAQQYMAAVAKCFGL